MKLENQVALVTGGARGIGREIALTLAKAGARVVIVDILSDEGERTARELDEITQGLFIQADITVVSNIEMTVERVLDEFGRLDVLVNNAGISVRADVDEITEEDYDRILDINLKAAVFFSREAAKVMKRQESGCIVNIASIRGVRADKTHSAYSITKAGMQALTRSLAVSLGEYGIRANSVSPGYVLTPMTRHNLDRPGWMEWLKSRVPAGRLIEMEEVADTVLFLASDASSGINGQDIPIDGGWTIHE